MRTLDIETPTHGRVLVRDVDHPSAVVVGFHGYGEEADVQMDRLVSLPGARRWMLVAVQGLHRFYRARSEVVVASWMTRQDRRLMIADNIEYVDRAVAAAAPAGVPLVMTGFSQGVAMAYRAAVRGRRPAAGIVAVGGDVPPELLEDGAARFPPTLIVRGERDDWYTAAKLATDLAALRARGVAARGATLAAGHEWTADVSAAASAFIEELHGPAER